MAANQDATQRFHIEKREGQDWTVVHTASNLAATRLIGSKAKARQWMKVAEVLPIDWDRPADDLKGDITFLQTLGRLQEMVNIQRHGRRAIA
jgi:hypothetical protein